MGLNRYVVPALRLSPVFNRYVVPALLLGRQLRDDVAAADRRRDDVAATTRP